MMKNLSLFDRRIASQISAQGKFRPPSKILLLFPPYLKFKAQKSIQEVLSKQELSPKVYGRAKNLGLAEQWGLEMKHWNIQQKHELVVALGESASWLDLAHPEISRCQQDSVLAVQRANKLILLKAVQQSPHRSRSDYEKSILGAWILDPDCDVYLDLLRKVVAYRLRKKNQYRILMEDFDREVVEFEVTKKLVRYLLSE